MSLEFEPVGALVTATRERAVDRSAGYLLLILVLSTA
jgi:hypothetical protein